MMESPKGPVDEKASVSVKGMENVLIWPHLHDMMESPKGQVDEKASVRVKGMERAEKRSVMAS